jgi:hypothetical protein
VIKINNDYQITKFSNKARVVRSNSNFAKLIEEEHPLEEMMPSQSLPMNLWNLQQQDYKEVANDLLNILRKIQLSLLEGELTVEKLNYILGYLHKIPVTFANQEMIKALRLRVEVELAKIKM